MSASFTSFAAYHFYKLIKESDFHVRVIFSVNRVLDDCNTHDLSHTMLVAKDFEVEVFPRIYDK